MPIPMTMMPGHSAYDARPQCLRCQATVPTMPGPSAYMMPGPSAYDARPQCLYDAGPPIAHMMTYADDLCLCL
ncbi:hypothetical protein BDBG_00498 [Blastomyces gilchristii SLH14081]|uniref:Uncharacterized protein n=1 Tax=Blastomyces gilchristii (strain SLH14081) TaxID=559298 RepID=A0A179U7N8_BLAGS|nr:uncharacterized protein BDBG_00498 [Blastomyces gilchristii SLH14081]OAT03820.1 hypothetical protein BDBG_00498 [Blastomyces gilchristii SLH14081]